MAPEPRGLGDVFYKINPDDDTVILGPKNLGPSYSFCRVFVPLAYCLSNVDCLRLVFSVVDHQDVIFFLICAEARGVGGEFWRASWALAFC